MSFFLGVSHTPGAQVLPRQREIVFDWGRVAKIVRWPIVATLIILAVVFVPALWGWQFHRTATGNGSWSMANEGGVMPMSAYYTAKSATYSVGDIVSFEYRAGATAQDNGPSIKQITSVHPDGSYTVAGLNELCSVPPCNVPPSDIRGKIVAGPVSLMPTAYWRWLSMGWTLNVDEIALRSERIFSMETLRDAFSEGGRFRNGVKLTYPPTGIRWGPGVMWVRTEGGASIVSEGDTELYRLQGVVVSWIQNKIVYNVIQSPTESPVYELDVRTGETRCLRAS
jgi:hypothetical protein